MIFNTAIGSSAPDVVQATPTITVSTEGLITAKATQAAGKVAEGTKSATKQLITQGATTITPGKTDKMAVQVDRYTTGLVMVKGDANLVAANIKSGVSIFGVEGSYGPKVISASNITFDLANHRIKIQGVFSLVSISGYLNTTIGSSMFIIAPVPPTNGYDGEEVDYFGVHQGESIMWAKISSDAAYTYITWKPDYDFFFESTPSFSAAIVL